ncbi:MAG: hypothetical protein R3E01_27045 [Pirellulaceae bacterium]
MPTLVRRSRRLGRFAGVAVALATEALETRTLLAADLLAAVPEPPTGVACIAGQADPSSQDLLRYFAEHATTEALPGQGPTRDDSLVSVAATAASVAAADALLARDPNALLPETTRPVPRLQPVFFPFLFGDYNFDECVDAADYTVFKDSFGSNVALEADGNGDAEVNAADYTIWKDGFGECE